MLGFMIFLCLALGFLSISLIPIIIERRFDLIAFPLICFISFIGSLIWIIKQLKTPPDFQGPDVPLKMLDPAENIEPGSLMRATIKQWEDGTYLEPRPYGPRLQKRATLVGIQIELTEEARKIIDERGLWDFIVFDYPNKFYDETIRFLTQDSSVPYESINQIPPHLMPRKDIVVSIKTLATTGHRRAFDTPIDAKVFAQQARGYLENLKNFIRLNKSLGKATETFDL